MRRVLKTRRSKAVIAVLVAAIAVTAAWAAWTLLTHDNSAAGKVASFQAPTMVADTAPSQGDLLPGGTGTAYVKVTNPNNAPVYMDTIAPDAGAGQADQITGGTIDCPSSNFSVATKTFAAGSRPVIPANASNVSLVLPDAIAMSASAPVACQGLAINFVNDIAATYTTAP